MAAPTQQSWSSIAKDSNYAGGARTFATESPKPNNASSNNNNNNNNNNPRQKRATSPSHIPKTSRQGQEEPVYILTLLTDAAHHKRMTALRQKYFPPKLNKLEAHLTLFHALPESKLEDTIIPTLNHVASETKSFDVHASSPFRMKKGFAIAVPKAKGGQEAQAVHAALQGPWMQEGWLSEQDAGGFRVHYTVMNKIDDEEEVAAAMEEVKASFKGDRGRVEGLGLWRYEKGYWKWVRGFEFETGDGKQ